MTIIHRIGTGVALALALATSAGPASARPIDLNANSAYVSAGSIRTNVVSSSPRGSAIVLGQSPSASPAAHPNPAEQTQQRSDAAAGRAVRVAGVPRCPVRGPCISPDSTLPRGLSAEEAAALGYRGGPVATTTGSPTDGSSASGHSPRLRAASSGETFGWGDAGIGAAGMLLLVSAGVGVAVTARRQRHRVTAS